jgi:hypothetical protein
VLTIGLVLLISGIILMFHPRTCPAGRLAALAGLAITVLAMVLPRVI